MLLFRVDLSSKSPDNVLKKTNYQNFHENIDRQNHHHPIIMDMYEALNPDPVSHHGWTPVPVDAEAIFQGKPYLHKPHPLLAKHIHFPSEDPIVAKVQDYAKSQLPSPTYNHSMRVFYWATAILKQQFPAHASSLSPSTLALTCLLHDIGTAPHNIHSTRLSFEFQGGIIALNLLQNTLSAPQPQAEGVCEAIIRHQDLGTTGKITFLGQLIQLATVYDNMSTRPYLVSEETKVDVMKEFPRMGWSKCFEKTIREENGLKPWAHTTHLGGEVFPNGVGGNVFMSEFE
ncbi:cyanamide hydratase [Podospora fimiseda]|uniref:Cyanamide hydratase n=1 Tax=Podospora fimiseda TaxID=252190 RepID=A0AAN7BMX4_9PEZI|nr:cyanamide hydratase [Podospora fimiseda]